VVSKKENQVVGENLWRELKIKVHKRGPRNLEDHVCGRMGQIHS